MSWVKLSSKEGFLSIRAKVVDFVLCIDWSRPCLATRIREFVMQLVSVCKFRHIVLLLHSSLDVSMF